MIKYLCVFCGSSLGLQSIYSDQAKQLGTLLSSRKIALVYGGANVGLMQVLADTVLNLGGHVIGVMPKSLVEREVAHKNLTEMHIVSDMQERKAMMADLSDAFIALPGAFGTLDELFEVLTWVQLGIIHKPIGLLNTDGYFNTLLNMLDHAVQQKFLRPEHRNILQVDDNIEHLLEKLETYQPVVAEKWIDRLKQGKI
ncbi:MAG: TIGR00730 family Rossman fold protein [Bacteroidales bacterium]|nr:TIGR00730 family Rossman fold protein [Bacteroidales bacterium]MDD4603341.1 TIGR00730 family Rossman fold protein [Bacteroidales bacterium]